jgi:hypothetical protein
LSLALAVALLSIDSIVEAKKLSKDFPRLRRRARELRQLAECELDEGSSYAEIEKFQQDLPFFRIIVFDDLKLTNVFFDQAPEDVELTLPLLLVHEHFSVIISYTAAFGCNYFCGACHRPYYALRRHSCKAKCQSCTLSPPCGREPLFDMSC